MNRIPSTTATIVAAAGLFVLSDPAAAQDRSYRFEITPFVAARSGGGFDEGGSGHKLELDDSGAQGFSFNIEANPNAQYEFMYARQSTSVDTQGLLVDDPSLDVDVEYIHLGGTYLFDGESTRPFIALTLGWSNFDPVPGEYKAEGFASASLGGGVRLFANKRFGVRLEGRMFTTFVDSDSSIFCSSDGGIGSCLIQVESDTVTQWEARAGLVFRF